MQGAYYLRTGPHKVIFSNMTMIDNMYGFGAAISDHGKGESKPGPKTNFSVELNNNKIYGEAPMPDCPPNGGYCY